MKNLLLVISVLVTISFMACGQTNTNVPEKVKTTFSEKFPDTKKVKWDKEEGEGWEAEFKMNGTKYSATFNEDGEWLETEHEVDFNKVPPIVKATLEIEFTDYKVEKSEISETADGKVYEFDLEKNKSEVEVAIDLNGKIVKKEVPEEDEEDND
jgi:hypothetical protein